VVVYAFLAVAMVMALFFWTRTIRSVSTHKSQKSNKQYNSYFLAELQGILQLIEEAIALAGIVNSLKKLTAFLIFILILAGVTIAFFKFFVAGPTNLSSTLETLAYLVIVFIFATIVFYFLSKTKKLLTPHIGLQAATVIQFLMFIIAGVVIGFVVLDLFSVDPAALLTSAGIITVTVGLIISTFVGGILSGALVFTTHRLKVGDDVMVNNMPGKVADMTALVTRIRTDVGQITVPNSAIASGGVIVTTVLPAEAGQESRLPYRAGDRVVTPFLNEQGIVKELTPYHTTIQLDSGKQVTFLNNSVLTGAVLVAKITQTPPPN
jgi:small-conductance mechanosensitive channel